MTVPLGWFGVVAVAIFAGVADALPPQKIFGGIKAAPGEFPYMVSLSNRGRVFCGGAIIGPRHIVTAAHCLEDVKPDMYPDISVATGSVFSNGGTRHAIHKLIPHPNYNSRSSDVVHDILIIELAEDIEFNENQTRVDLPTDFVLEGVFANLTGWGQPDWEREVVAAELMKIRIMTLRADTCNSYGESHNIHWTQICTYGGYGAGACNSDGGGPLVYKGQLIGVLTHGLPCSRGVPDVYTSVYHYLDWIKKTMRE